MVSRGNCESAKRRGGIGSGVGGVGSDAVVNVVGVKRTYHASMYDLDGIVSKDRIRESVANIVCNT